MLPTEGRSAKFVGVSEELDLETACEAASLAALNGLAVARECLGLRLTEPTLLEMDEKTRFPWSNLRIRWLKLTRSCCTTHDKVLK